MGMRRGQWKPHSCLVRSDCLPDRSPGGNPVGECGRTGHRRGRASPGRPATEPGGRGTREGPVEEPDVVQLGTSCREPDRSESSD